MHKDLLFCFFQLPLDVLPQRRGWRPTLIPRSALMKSQLESTKSEVFMAIGTTALVYPAAAYPVEAIQQNKPLIEVNPEVTQLSEYATIVVRAPSGIALPLIVQRIKELDLMTE